MNSSILSQIPDTPQTPSNNDSDKSRSKSNLIRTSTAPTTFATPPSNELTRQMSASPSLSNTPYNAITQYLKNLLGLNAKTTKRSLSEEAECGSPDSIAEWLRTGSDPNELDAYGYTPLVNACLKGCFKSCKVLIDHGANVNMKAMHGYYPLHAAAQNGHSDIVELLVESGAQMELKNEDGDTPLMLAVRSNQLGVVDILCKRGCNLHTQGFDHIEPIDYAINKRNLFISDVLMKHERQHLNSTSSSVNESSSNSQNHSEDLINKNSKQNSNSLTSLIQEEQQKHLKEQNSKQDDSTLFETE